MHSCIFKNISYIVLLHKLKLCSQTIKLSGTSAICWVKFISFSTLTQYKILLCCSCKQLYHLSSRHRSTHFWAVLFSSHHMFDLSNSGRKITSMYYFFWNINIWLHNIHDWRIISKVYLIFSTSKNRKFMKSELSAQTIWSFFCLFLVPKEWTTKTPVYPHN